MPAQAIYQGPIPPAGEKFCFVCAYTWKVAVNEHYEKEIEALMTAPDDTIVVLDGNAVDAPAPALAVATGLWSPLQQLGALDLCWSHVTAIRLQTPSGIHLPPPGGAGMGLPPGFGVNGEPR